MSSLKIHTSIAGATAIKAVGEVMVSCKWKETANQQRKERAILVPMECVSAPEVPEAFRALVECALSESASSVLKTYCDQEENSYEVNAELFTRPNLTEAFMQRGEVWLSKQELELGFTASATWKRITSRQEFQNNTAYKAAAEQFKAAILKLTGKAVQMKKEQCEAILAKLSPEDLETNFGNFVVKRLTQLSRKQISEEFNLDLL